MENFVQEICITNIPPYKSNNSQHLMDLTLLDEATNIQYILKVDKEAYNRAHNGIILLYTHIYILIITIINNIYNDVKVKVLQ